MVRHQTENECITEEEIVSDGIPYVLKENQTPVEHEKSASVPRFIDQGCNTEQGPGETENKDVQVGEPAPVMRDDSVQVSLPFISPKDLRQNDDKIKFYTGFVSFAMFWHYLFYDLYQTWEGEERCGNAPVSAYHQTDGQKPGRKRFLRPADEFPLVCMRLRLGLLQRHLADLFCISTTTVSRIVNTWMNYLLDHCNARFTLWRIGTTSLLRVLV